MSGVKINGAKILQQCSFGVAQEMVKQFVVHEVMLGGATAGRVRIGTDGLEFDMVISVLSKKMYL